jgi:putative FmdB family regulatory protein
MVEPLLPPTTRARALTETQMPIYEYACRACGHTFEEWQKMSDAPVRTCPKCKKKKVDKLISQTAFQLKGGGWYADLYSSKPQAGKDAGKDGKDGKDGGKDTDSGAAATKEASGGKDAAPAASEKKDAKPAGATAKPDGKQDRKKSQTPKKSESRAA